MIPRGPAARAAPARPLRTAALLVAALLIGGRPAPATGQPARAAGCLPVTDLAATAPGHFPADWKPRDATARAVYRVLEEGGLRFVRATAAGSGSQMGREFPWDLATHPVLAWRWRPRVFPTGADERDGSRNDSALGVYAVFPYLPMTVKTVKYVWSLSAPAGATASASAGLTRLLVVRSGRASDGGWVEEAADVAADYQRFFGEAPPRPLGLAVLTDADQTRSRAEGDYADFRVCPAGRRPEGQPG